jgi:hypothetical protein
MIKSFNFTIHLFFHHQKTDPNQNLSSSHHTTNPVTNIRNKSIKKFKADLKCLSDTNTTRCDDSASESNSLFDQMDVDAVDDNDSEMDSLFDYDGSGEEADEEADESDVSINSS